MTQPAADGRDWSDRPNTDTSAKNYNRWDHEPLHYLTGTIDVLLAIQKRTKDEDDLLELVQTSFKNRTGSRRG